VTAPIFGAVDGDDALLEYPPRRTFSRTNNIQDVLDIVDRALEVVEGGTAATGPLSNRGSLSSGRRASSSVRAVSGRPSMLPSSSNYKRGSKSDGPSSSTPPSN
jgi:hypothetical protein